MKLKRIYAPNTKIGIDRITAQCGDNVMILSNRREDDQNVILVAFDDCTTTSKPEQDKLAANFASILDARNSRLQDKLKQGKEQASAQHVPMKAAPEAQTNAQAMPESRTYDEGRVMQSLASQIREELMSLKQEIVSLKRHRNSEPLSQLEHQLLANLRETGAADHVIEECRQLLDSASDSQAIDSLLAEHLRQIGITGKSLEPGIHALLGSHGSGKTTMAIKLAQRLQAVDKPAIVISYKDNKEGAWSVLRLLGSRAGITTYQAQNAECLKAIVEEYADRASIVIDTSSATLDTAPPEIKDAVEHVKFHAVLPVDTYLGSMLSISGLESTRFESALLTRLDQKIVPWPIIKLLHRSQTRTSLGCMSSDPAEELTQITAQTLSDKLRPEDQERPPIPVQNVSYDNEFAFQVC